MKSAAYFQIAAVVGVAAGIAGCGTPAVTIASDDAALCHYAAEAGNAESVAACRGRLDNQHRTRTAANVSRIEGYALLNTPAPPTALVGQCGQRSPPKECEAGDVTGTIKRDTTK